MVCFVEFFCFVLVWGLSNTWSELTDLILNKLVSPTILTWEAKEEGDVPMLFSQDRLDGQAQGQGGKSLQTCNVKGEI